MAGIGVILSVVGNLLGIGKDALNNRAKRKTLIAEQEHAIIKAQTDAVVDRIMSNTESDNAIDLITARDKKFTNKDEIITYTFLIPVFIATATPFIQAWTNSDWTNLSEDIQASYENLNRLPTWYKYVLGAIIIDVLGFRSFARKLIERFIDKK
jgi:hypothetical protein